MVKYRPLKTLRYYGGKFGRIMLLNNIKEFVFTIAVQILPAVLRQVKSNFPYVFCIIAVTHRSFISIFEFIS